MDCVVNCIQWGKGLVKAIEIYHSLGSTNDFARCRIKSGGDSGTVLWALQQTQGRGRRGRAWDADHSSLTFSLIWRCPSKIVPPTLTLLVGLGLVQQLEAFIPELKVKWPNDLWVGDKKLGGILTETMRQDRALWVIIGIGLNVNSISNDHASPRTSLRAASNCFWSRLAVLDQALLGVERGFDLLDQHRDLGDLFRKYGNFLDRPILVHQGGQVFPALATDVAQDGRLIIKDARGERALLPEEISLRF